MACNTSYGAQPTGFMRKPFDKILTDLREAAIAAHAEAEAIYFDNEPRPALEIDDASPQGQMIGIFADALDDIWQQLQGNADNSDLSKAEGCQLDKLALLRGFSRNDNEADATFRARLLGINTTGVAGNTILDNLITSLYNIDVEDELDSDGNAVQTVVVPSNPVTCVKVNVNETGNTNTDGLPPHSYEVVVQGGDDDKVAAVIWKQHPAGITLHGDTSVEVDTQLNCQTVLFSRPQDVPICAEVKLRAISDSCGCTQGDIARLEQALRDHMGGDCPDCRFGIGDDVVYNSLFEPFYANFTGFIVQSLRIKRASDTDWTTENISIGANERGVLTFAPDCTSIEFV